MSDKKEEENQNNLVQQDNKPLNDLIPQDNKQVEKSKKDPVGDFTPKEVRQLKAYISNGLPGLHLMTEDKQMRAFQLYKAGRSYEEISFNLKIRKEAILYIADKERWYEQKLERYEQMVSSLKPKLTLIQIESKHFLMDLISSTHQYYQDRINEYMRSKDPSILEGMNHKLLDKYFKSLELLYKLEDASQKSPTVNLSIPEGSRIERVDKDTVQITPSDDSKKDIAAILAALAELNDARDNRDD